LKLPIFHFVLSPIYFFSLIFNIEDMAFDTGMSKEGKKLLKSTDENIHHNMKNLLSPEDWDIFERNTKKEAEKAMKQMAKFAAKNGISFPVK
jgi:hypothetical protein